MLLKDPERPRLDKDLGEVGIKVDPAAAALEGQLRACRIWIQPPRQPIGVHLFLHQTEQLACVLVPGDWHRLLEQPECSDAAGKRRLEKRGPSVLGQLVGLFEDAVEVAWAVVIGAVAQQFGRLIGLGYAEILVHADRHRQENVICVLRLAPVTERLLPRKDWPFKSRRKFHQFGYLGLVIWNGGQVNGHDEIWLGMGCGTETPETLVCLIE